MKSAQQLLKFLRWSFAVFALLGLLLIGYSWPRLTFENDILALFPHSDQIAGVTQADERIAGRVTRKVFFLIAAADGDTSRAALPAFIQTLQACDCFAEVSATFDGQAIIDLQKIYSDYTPQLLSPEHREILRADKGEVLVHKALRDLLSNPTAGIEASLSTDPLGTLAAFSAQTRATSPNLRIDDSGYISFVDGDKPYFLLYAELAGSPYSLDVQQQAQAAIAAAEGPVAALPGGDIIKTGALFYTLAGTEQARGEISTVGLGSALGIIFILLLVFRSPGLVVLAFVPIVFGVMLGLVVCNWLFGSVHVVALVFGSSLVGVAIDYVLHFFTRRHAMGAAWTAESGTRHLLPALGLGLLSSVAAYLSFTTAGFPGFSQVAVFSATGLITACWMVVGLFPWLLKRPAKRPIPAFLVRGTKAYRTLLGGLAGKMKSPLLLVILAAVIVGGWWRLSTVDDIRAMQIPDPDLRAMELRFQSLVGQSTALQYLLVSADGVEPLLQKLERLHDTLYGLQGEGALAGSQSLANYLPSERRRGENQQVYRQALIESGQLPALFEQLGVVPEFREQVLAKFSRQASSFLTLEQIEPLLHHLPDGPVYFTEGEQFYAVILLRGVENPEALSALADAEAGVVWVDLVAQTNQLLKDYRQATTVTLAIAYLLIWLLFSWRYSWHGSLAIVAPPLLATLLSLAILGWMGEPISVFNLMALLLVLGIGIDAALFMRESGNVNKGIDNKDPNDPGYETLLAIALATLTTVLSFGLLSLSATAAIHSFGITILLGIVFCFIFSPLAAISTAGGVAQTPDTKRQGHF